MLGKVIGAGLAAYASVGPMDLAPTPLSRLIKAIAANTGDGAARVACGDTELSRIMKREGLQVDGDARVAWAGTEAEVKAFSQAGKLVLCPNPDWVRSGAAIVVQVDGGKPVYYIYTDQVKLSGIYVRAAVFHYAKERR